MFRRVWVVGLGLVFLGTSDHLTGRLLGSSLVILGLASWTLDVAAQRGSERTSDAVHIDYPRNDDRTAVECLACGALRTVSGLTRTALGLCPHCGYVGWALPADLTDQERGELRTRSWRSGKMGARQVTEPRAPHERTVMSKPDVVAAYVRADGVE